MFSGEARGKLDGKTTMDSILSVLATIAIIFGVVMLFNFMILFMNLVIFRCPLAWSVCGQVSNLVWPSHLEKNG